jgi:hypothetical protein
VTSEDVQKLAQEFFHPDRVAASVVGALNGFELTPSQLQF